ncbi:MAG: S-layer homology domain-containing protein, partial [Oscillospiraceae bacterium]|nr:S-layer homology domain-containing protein [Oscillospiraceae bacterium]
YGDKMYTDYSISSPETSRRLITMGTVLERMDEMEPGTLVINRLPVHNYAVYLPVRNEDGSYSKHPAMLNAREKLSESYLPLTKANIAKVAFGALGDAYGWGAMLYNEDCTSFNRNIFLCFGLDLPRNTNWQWLMPIDTLSIADWPVEAKEAVLDKLPLGTLLQFPGHQMLYLGKCNDKYYVYSTVSSAMNPWQDGKRQRVRTTLINTLDVKRANGNTWMQSLSGVELPWVLLGYDGNSHMPDAPWYLEGVSFCMKNKLMDTQAGRFRPNETATRAELVDTMWRCAKSPDPVAESVPFTDVPADAAYLNALLWAWENDVVKGTSETSFSPESGITREMLAVILYRFSNGSADEHRADLSAFEDAGDISDWALDAVQWAVDVGLIKGTSDTAISPGGEVTRAQLATLIMRYSSMDLS